MSLSGVGVSIIGHFITPLQLAVVAAAAAAADNNIIASLESTVQLNTALRPAASQHVRTLSSPSLSSTVIATDLSCLPLADEMNNSFSEGNGRAKSAPADRRLIGPYIVDMPCLILHDVIYYRRRRCRRSRPTARGTDVLTSNDRVIPD